MITITMEVKGMKIKKVIAGSIIAGMGITGMGASIAFADDEINQDTARTVSASTKEKSETPDNKSDMPEKMKEGKFKDVSLPKDVLTSVESGTNISHQLFILDHYKGVPIIKHATLGDERVEGIDEVIDQVEFDGEPGEDMKRQIMDTDASATALPMSVADPTDKIFKEWLDRMNELEFNLDPDLKIKDYEKALEDALGDDFKDAMNNEDSSNMKFVFFDEENLDGEGSFKLLSLDGNDAAGFSTVNLDGEDSGMVANVKFDLVAEPSGDDDKDDEPLDYDKKDDKGE